MKNLKKVLALVLAFASIFCFPVLASTDTTIDQTKTATLNIYKYDLTNASSDGVWDTSSYVSTGEMDQTVLDTLANYAIQGVEFTFLKIADISTLEQDDGTGNYSTILLYGLPENDTSAAFLSALGLSYSNAEASESGVHYFHADTLTKALSDFLLAGNTTVKNALEALAANGAPMTETDEYGHTSAGDLPLGLYLVVETKVPEDVTATCDPFLVSLPMTNNDGTAWNYDVVVYPKNATGDPTLEKTVRESTASGSKSEAYGHTATASTGDTVNYRITSTLPTITSKATHLSQYTFVDTMASGISYIPNSMVIRFYSDTACSDLVATWNLDAGKFTAVAENNVLTIAMTEAGLSEINDGYSEYTMEICYDATLASDGSVATGSTGNHNTVVLTWKRSNTEYSDTLKDDCHVYTYALDLTKKFSDGAGNFANVQFTMTNTTDNSPIRAIKVGDVYHVTNGSNGTDTFTPNADGHLYIKGLENDSYSLKEMRTDAGYTLLQEPISMSIAVADGEVCTVCSEEKLTASAVVSGKDATMAADGSVPVTVMNTKGFELPKTGSYGTWMFTAGGLLAMGSAVILLLRNKKKKQ